MMSTFFLCLKVLSVTKRAGLNTARVEGNIFLNSQKQRQILGAAPPSRVTGEQVEGEHHIQLLCSCWLTVCLSII